MCTHLEHTGNSPTVQDGYYCVSLVVFQLQSLGKLSDLEFSIRVRHVAHSYGVYDIFLYFCLTLLVGGTINSF